jgi:hypothetical protein
LAHPLFGCRGHLQILLLASDLRRIGSAARREIDTAWGADSMNRAGPSPV